MSEDFAFIPAPPPTPAPPEAPPGSVISPIKLAPILVPLAQLLIILFNEQWRRQCEQTKKECNCYAAVPEWWAARPGYNRPQLILHFRQKDGQGKWIRNGSPSVITIPWANAPTGNMYEQPPVEQHTRGKILSEIELNDNSRIRLFCQTKEIGVSIMEQCLSVVRSGYLPSNNTPSNKEMRANDVYAEKTVYPFKAIYLSSGAVANPTSPPKVYYYDR